MTTTAGGCSAMNLSNNARVSFLRNFNCPVIEAPWRWNTFFARSTPIIVSFICRPLQWR